MERSESALVERAKTDPAAFGELYLRHVDQIYNYIYHRVGHVAEAEDLTARTFQRALSGMGGYVDRGLPFGAWLFRIAHNLTANWHRDQNRRVSVPLDGLDTELDGRGLWDPLGDRLTAQLLAERRISEAIRRLEPDRQDLLILKFSQGLSNAEIGVVLGRSEGAVKSLYHRTLIALREQLEATGGVPELDEEAT
jgi:RNA polymerase sigma-70 factor (ECF subfamily)